MVAYATPIECRTRVRLPVADFPPGKDFCEGPPAPREFTLLEFYRRHYAPEVLPGAKHAETRRLCEIALKHMQRFWGCDPLLSACKAPLLKRWLGWMATPPEPDEQYQGRPLPASPEHAVPTANKNLRHVRAIVAYAAELELVRPLPRIRLLKAAKKRPKSWSLAQVSAMLQAAQRVQGEIGEVPARLWWQALVLFLFDTGCRITAAMSVRWQDVDWDAQAVTIIADNQKQREEQFLGLSPQTLDALRAIHGPRGLVFAWPFDHSRTGRTLWKTLRTRFRRCILAPAGVPDEKGKCLHKFRRTNITQIKKAGGNATLQAGHSSAAVTKLYEDPGELGPVREVDRLPRPQTPSPQLHLFS